MPIVGYRKSRPDADWWMEQIKAGEAYRKKTAYEQQWKVWRDYYRGEWDKTIMPVNLFFTLMRTTVPRIYFRNPTISIVSAKPGMENMAFAKMLERIDNKLLRQMKFKKHMKRCIQDSFMFGTGFGKIGFGGLYSSAINSEEDIVITDPKGRRVEYFADVQESMPWFNRVSPGSMVLPHGLGEFDKSRWIAEKIIRPVEDVRADPRMENTKGLHGNKLLDTPTALSIQRPENLVELYEVRDLKTGKVFVIAPDKDDDKVLLFEDDTFQRGGSFPYFPLVFNEDDERFWGIPDSKILEPYQLELNETRTQIMKHRRLTLVKILVKQGSMKEEEIEKLISEDVAAVAFIQGDIDKTVKLIQNSTIPPELFAMADRISQDVRETIGFSRNQFGEFNSRSGDTTATEASIVQQASEIRVDERRDMVADIVVDVVERMHLIIFEHWDQEQIIDVVGPGGVPIWVRFRGELLKRGRYNVSVDPDSSVPETRALREQKALQLYQVLRSNPIIDPVKLTQYMLRELRGVAFDDMMRMLPPALGGPVGGVVSPEQFTNQIGNSLQQVSNNPEALRPPLQLEAPNANV